LHKSSTPYAKDLRMAMMMMTTMTMMLVYLLCFLTSVKWLLMNDFAKNFFPVP
jgi:hypothetical protein